VTSRRLIVSPRGTRAIESARGWWRRNRDKAPSAFDEDVEDAFGRIVEQPFNGIRGRDRHGRTTHRVLLERIRYYVYYRVTDATVEVITIWHASRRPPRL
jgi:plasmid stabilization system protein ParE